MVYIYRYYFQGRWSLTKQYFRDDKDFLSIYMMTEVFHKLPESGFYADGESKVATVNSRPEPLAVSPDPVVQKRL